MASGALFGSAEARPSATPDDPDNDWTVPASRIRRLETLASGDDAMPSLTAAAEDAKEVLIFIHGFSNDFRNAVRRTARLAARCFAQPPLAIALTWPSAGDFIGVPFPQTPYLKDEASAFRSGPQLALALRAALRALGRPLDAPPAPGAPKVTMIAHSMGNRALRAMALNLGAITQTPIDRSFLMAADEDTDQLLPTGDFANVFLMSRAVDCYYALNDDALLYSQKLNGSSPFLRKRLGLFVPQDKLLAAPTLSAVNCSDVSDTDLLGANHYRHQYYRARPEVVEDIRLMIRSGASGQRQQDPLDQTGRGFAIRPATV